MLKRLGVLLVKIMLLILSSRYIWMINGLRQWHKPKLLTTIFPLFGMNRFIFLSHQGRKNYHFISIINQDWVRIFLENVLMLYILMMKNLTGILLVFEFSRWVDLYNKSNEKKVKGQLRYQVQFFPRIDSGVLEVLEATGADDKLDKFTYGLMHLNIIEAKDLSIFPGISPQLLGTLFYLSRFSLPEWEKNV